MAEDKTTRLEDRAKREVENRIYDKAKNDADAGKRDNPHEAGIIEKAVDLATFGLIVDKERAANEDKYNKVYDEISKSKI